MAVLDPGLNATLLPGAVPREAAVALWSTPERLLDLVPPTRLSDTSIEPSAGTAPGRFVLWAGPERGTLTIDCRIVPLRAVLDELAQLGLEARATRSLRALGHLTRCALEIAARGHLQPDIDPTGMDVWVPEPLTPTDRARMSALAQWLPPESCCTVDPASGDLSGATIRPADAVERVIAAVVDILPRTPASAALLGIRPWASMGTSAVAERSGQLRETLVHRRSILQLRLVPTDDSAGGAHLDFFLRSEAAGFVPTPAHEVWAAGTVTGARDEEDLLFLLSDAARIWPTLARTLEEAQPGGATLSAAEVDELLGEAGTRLAAAGVEVMIPASLARPLRPLPVVRIVDPENGGTTDRSTGLFSVDSLCAIEWSVQVDGRTLTPAEVEALVAAQRRLVRLNDGWVLLDDDVIRRLRRVEKLGAAAALGEALAAAAEKEERQPDPTAAAVSTAVAAPQVADLSTSLSDPRIVSFIGAVRAAMNDEGFAAPRGLQGELRPYQRAGLAWLSSLATAGFGGILADDMGLGKTIQVIAAHLALHENNEAEHSREGRSGESNGAPPSNSVVGPTLVIAPAGLLHNWTAELTQWAPSVRVHHFHGPGRSLGDIGSADVVVTTYGIVRREVDRLGTRRWGLVVADEAQAIKNRTSATARALRSLGTGVRFALTGTPVENHLGELWSILEWTTPGLLGPIGRFERDIIGPIEREGDPVAQARLGRMIGPFMLRRTKSDPRIIPELPPRTITDRLAPLTPEQAALYRAVASETVESVRNAAGMARRGAIFKLMTALKQVANHPAHYLGQDGPLVGRSGKFDLTLDLVSEIVDSGQSVVIFTQYVAMAHLLVAGLGSVVPVPGLLHGGASLPERDRLVRTFQSGALPVLVVSLRAGGVGLNLTAATHVIHFDRWWNPAVENQASDRVWRIGQTRPVQVHRLIAAGTIEEKVAALLESKQSLADRVLDEAAWLSELSDTELLELIHLDESTLEEPGA